MPTDNERVVNYRLYLHNMTDQVIIIGAGVAGLSLAIFLAERNIKSVVVESRVSFDDRVTSGVRISTDGVRVLNSLGLKPIGQSTEQILMEFGKIHANFRSVKSDYSAITVTRLALHEQLMEKSEALNIKIITNFKVECVVKTSTGVIVTSESGTTVTGKIVVGADGVGSLIRKLLNPNQDTRKRYAGYLGVGIITPNEDNIEMTLQHYIGHQMGIASCGQISSKIDSKYAFLWTHFHMTEKKAMEMTLDDIHTELTQRSTLWNSFLFQIYTRFKVHSDTQYAYYPVYNGNPPLIWYNDYMILMGDAAHPYGPGGQGISMALKDAYALSDVITQGFTEELKLQYYLIRSQESRVLGESAERRNQRTPASNTISIFLQGILMKIYQWLSGGVIKF